MIILEKREKKRSQTCMLSQRTFSPEKRTVPTTYASSHAIVTIPAIAKLQRGNAGLLDQLKASSATRTTAETIPVSPRNMCMPNTIRCEAGLVSVAMYAGSPMLGAAMAMTTNAAITTAAMVAR